MVNVGTFKKR